MGWFDQVRQWFGGGASEQPTLGVPLTGTDADVPALQIQSVAAALQLESKAPAIHQRGLSRAESHPCSRCGKPLSPALFTTWGGPAWADRPMAMDGWRCEACGNLTGLAFLTPEQVVAIEAAGAAAGQRGDLDAAEFHFRRILTSWVDHPMALLNLASVYMDRLRADGLSPEQELRYKGVVEAEMRRAALADPVPHPFVFQTLARICAYRGDEEEARQFLERLRADSRTPPPMHAEADTLEDYLRGLGWLYEHGSKRVQEAVFDAPEPPSFPLKGEVAASVDKGVQALLRFAERHPDHWQCRFFLGKGQQALGRLEEADRWMTAADALDHGNPNVGRELAGIRLERGDAPGAVEASRRALELAGDDAGLHANLALALLIAGEDEGAGAEAARAAQLDPTDRKIQLLEELVIAVAAGERPRPDRLLPGGRLDA